MNALFARQWQRFIGVLLGITVIFWLPIEDTSTTAVTLLAVPSAFLMGVRLLEAVRGKSLLAHAGVGLASGIAVAPITAAFMLVKIGLHSHGNAPDFYFEDFVQVFDRTLFFGAAGLLIGTGIKLTFLSK